MAAAGSWMKAMGMQLGQKIGDSGYKTFTGKERQHLGADGKNNGFLKVGQQFYDKDAGVNRIATMKDVKKAANEKLNASGVGNLDSLKAGSLGKHFVQTDKDRNSGSTGGGTEAPEENTSQIKLPQNEDRNGFGVK